MSPKRKDRVAPPPKEEQWDIRYATNDAVRGWEELCQQAPGNTNNAWHLMRDQPGAARSSRHMPLKGILSTGLHDGRRLPMWQIEVTGGGRIFYLIDAERHTIWIQYAGTGHPKVTD